MVTNIGTQTIETERLILRRFEYSDIDSMIRNWIADEQTQWDYGEPCYSTPEAVRELFDTKYIVSYSKDDYYPEINGVSPTLEPYDDSKMLKYMGHHFYKGINYSVSYSGKLLAVSGFLTKYMVYMGPQRLRAYNQVSEWTFENGKVIDCKDLNSVIQSFRDELEEKVANIKF